MNVHFSYKLSKSPALEQQINTQIDKLRRRLQVFRPELISLYGTVDEGRKTGVVVSLNLRLPSGQMAAQSAAETDGAAVRSAFDDIIEQLTKHKDQLRNQKNWPRRGRTRRDGREDQASTVPFQETHAAVQPDLVSEQDITSYVNANLSRLQRFVVRELRFRVNNGQLRNNQLSPEEVIDEAIANALDDHSEKPEKLRLEPWLYRLATRAMQRLTDDARDESVSVRLESTPHLSRSDGSDEPVLQFHQPDESITQEDLIADTRAATPEQVAATDEMIGMVELALREAKPEEREAFILFTMEGFTVHEIAVITDRKEERVRSAIGAAREHLRKAFPVQSVVKQKLIEHSKTA
jgi:RNA polymerase sigma factor (sigma-70 family)